LTWEHNSFRNWRQIFKTPEIDVCSLLTAANFFPALQKFLETIREFHPFFPTKCPILPHAEYYYNIPIGNENEGILSDGQNPISLPNGLYRYRGWMNSKTDPVGGFFELIMEYKRKQDLDTW
jgi:hypothetical protein